MTETQTMERNWTEVGAKYREGDDLERVEQAVEALDWQEMPEGGSLSAPAMPGFSINACIEQLRLPKVTAVAWNGALSYPDGDDGLAHYQLIGIECNYKNGRCRLYVLDTGGGVTPVASDFWPKA